MSVKYPQQGRVLVSDTVIEIPIENPASNIIITNIGDEDLVFNFEQDVTISLTSGSPGHYLLKKTLNLPMSSSVMRFADLQNAPTVIRFLSNAAGTEVSYIFA